MVSDNFPPNAIPQKKLTLHPGNREQKFGGEKTARELWPDILGAINLSGRGLYNRRAALFSSPRIPGSVRDR